MQLFYDPQIAPPRHTFGEEESRHCVRVLRLREGDRLHATDGRGTLYECRVAEADPRGCTVEILSAERNFEPLGYRLAMGVAPTKNADRFEWFLEKATEVGVTSVVPLETEHSERRVFNPRRGEHIITAAMKQSLKAFRPELQAVTPLDEVLRRPFEGRKFIAHCAEARSEGGKSYFPQTLRPGEAALVLIGPEGDFSADEIDRALACGFEEIALGPQRLRTETAALVAVVMAATVNGMKN
ncbi:MAG: 16S rRNA (uracil(1498)-N(3))-methyltransferase [Alistipes sp.]|nr:16S rRNA (uracil(1498)-N(3))-methyltransferase [Alistipes senegalensis]MCM1249926.1 16S rRNA (uracil(1498)-N(3))-methyltransferase [Alistipes sp.]